MSSRRRFRTAALAIVAGVAFVACGGSDDAASTPTADSAATPATADTTAVADTTAAADEQPEPEGDAPADADVPEILRFSNPLVGGGELDATELAGTPTAFWFWAPT